MTAASITRTYAVVERQHIQQLFEVLSTHGYQLIGPTVRDCAIMYDVITSVDDLPIGYTDEQREGYYRLKKRDDEALFGYNVGPHSWKRFLHPPVLRLWRARREHTGTSFQITPELSEVPKRAFIGVRSCDLHAIFIQDRVFLGDRYVDPAYQERRNNICIIAVQCGQAGGTCFCTSMQTGPRASHGFDLALTEVLTPPRHYFVAETGTALGAELLEAIDHVEASEEAIQQAYALTEQASQQMGKTMDTTDIKDLLSRNLEHPQWENVATRCLTCGNCTMVCPTCFCTSVEDTTDVTGTQAERWRTWDSCFSQDFSYLHGGSVRSSAKSRYRQWMTHKLGTWIDQFGSSGCVGCGRCITWCPVGIDITAEVRAIRASDSFVRKGDEDYEHPTP
ncbi:4Fe-4S ferredoxin [Ktedonobacter sp. SOSP1-85]|uniref:4Fe-4S dicluster domain-containing protein n=1 Tax=Ktedonobacter sp. SOSP1-85 TaxID=2778367 RepID=UPI0019164DAE|nr:4Fe-4S dicluster domain-containing protein [Ktedonobacter sp. SOSP1-85]GHO80198.1 4Fe-4S ferredoxin [Ktedonobacter sp. SOSP1-85]